MAYTGTLSGFNREKGKGLIKSGKHSHVRFTTDDVINFDESLIRDGLKIQFCLKNTELFLKTYDEVIERMKWKSEKIMRGPV